MVRKPPVSNNPPTAQRTSTPIAFAQPSILLTRYLSVGYHPAVTAAADCRPHPKPLAEGEGARKRVRVPSTNGTSHHEHHQIHHPKHLLGMQRPLRVAGHGGGRPRDAGVAQSGTSGVARGVLREGDPGVAGADLSSGPGALSHEAHGAAGWGAVAAGVVGRGAGRDGGRDAGGAGAVWPDGALRCGEQRALQPRGGAGAVAARLRFAQLDDEPGPLRRVSGVERPDHGAGHRQGRGYRQHPLCAHRRAQSVCG